MNGNDLQQRTLRRYKPPNNEKDRDVMAIHTGLSVTVAGHLIELDRDDERKTARVVVHVLPGHIVTGLETEAVSVAAKLLAGRARRFLGSDWTVVDLTPGNARRSSLIA